MHGSPRREPRGALTRRYSRRHVRGNLPAHTVPCRCPLICYHPNAPLGSRLGLPWESVKLPLGSRLELPWKSVKLPLGLRLGLPWKSVKLPLGLRLGLPWKSVKLPLGLRLGLPWKFVKLPDLVICAAACHFPILTAAGRGGRRVGRGFRRGPCRRGRERAGRGAGRR